MSNFFDKSLGRPIHGVSQQDETLRLEGQCNAQLNMTPDPVYGVVRRVPTRFRREVTPFSDYIRFTDEGGEKVLCLRDGETPVAQVYDLHTDTFFDVTLSLTAYNYLRANKTGSNPSKLRIRSAAVKEAEDDTKAVYFNNPTVVVEQDTEATYPERFMDDGYVHCLGGRYSREYIITIQLEEISTGTVTEYTGTYTTPNGTSGAHVALATSTYIIEQLETSLNTGTPDCTITRKEDHLMFEADTGFRIVSLTANSDGDDLLIPVFRKLKRLDQLPRYAKAGTVLAIDSTDGDKDDSYFEFVPHVDIGADPADTFGVSGTWAETVRVGDEFSFDWGTMPVRLYLDAGDYYLDVAEWQDRVAGNATSSPAPSIVGSPIKDIAVVQSRLVLLGTSSLVFSRVRHPRQLWRRTVVGDLSPDSPVDGNSDTSRGEYTFLTVANGDLVVFSRLGQFAILGSVAITPNSIGLIPATSSSNIEYSAPVACGQNVYGAINTGDFIGLNEYYKSDNTFFAEPVSSHVPRYMRGSILDAVGISSQSTVFIQTDADLSELYCYRFLFNGNERVQSAWFKYDLNYPIKFMAPFGNSLFVVTEISGNHVFEVMDFGVESIFGLDYIPSLDRYTEYTVGENGETLIFDIHRLEGSVAVSTTEGKSKGMVVDLSYDEISGLTTVFGLEEGDTFMVGHRYTSEYSPTHPRVFDESGMVIQTSQLNVPAVFVNVLGTGNFDWEVVTQWGQTTAGTAVARTMDSPFNLIGSETLLDRQVRVPWIGDARSKTLTLRCDEHTPMTIAYIEFQGDLRAQRQRK